MNYLDSYEKAKECLTDAEFLLSGNRWHATVSRAYYAMFHAAQALLLANDIVAHTHKGVSIHFNKHFVKTKLFNHQLGRKFDKIREERERSDYEIGFRASKELAHDTVNDAKLFITQIGELLDK